MKRLAIILVAALLCAGAASAQDLLVKRDGTKVRVKVLEITGKRITYVRFMTESPVYKIPLSEIEYIEYPDGERDTFGPKKKKAPAADAETPEKWRGPVRPPVSVAEVSAEAPSADVPRYNVGDIYSEDGATGMVVITTDNGAHGLIMSLDEACLAWCDLPRRDMEATGATDNDDGVANMAAVERFIADKGLSWSDFPAFEWCRSKGDGWFLPSINELWRLGTVYNGGSRTIFKRAVRKSINDTLKSNGGKVLNNIMLYHSSTESSDPKYSFYSHMGVEKPYTGDGAKGDKLFVRAFRHF